MLIDWKTAEKEKNRVEDLYDNPLQVIFLLSLTPCWTKPFPQLAAYLGAINRDPRLITFIFMCATAIPSEQPMGISL